MAARKPKKPVLNKEQTVALAGFMDKNFSSHGISLEETLKKMVEVAGCTIQEPSGERKPSKSWEVKVIAPNGAKLVTVVLLHRTKFEQEIIEENLGGHVKPGDWWGFTALFTVESIVAILAGFESGKIGRGGRFCECIEAFNKYAKEMQG